MVSLPNWVSRFRDERVDFTEPRSFGFGLLQVGLAAVEFALLLFLLVSTGLVTRSMIDAVPPSKGLTLLVGFVPALVLGAGLPYLVQRREAVRRLNSRPAVRLAGVTLTFGTYVGLVFVHPVAGVVYAVTYLSSRIVVLVGIFGAARIGWALA